MAASLSRPDPTSPASVAEAGFSTARRGFSPDEVRAFLTSVSSEMRRLHEREQQLEAELRAVRANRPGPVELDEATITTMLGEETVRVLQTARESAGQIKERAEEHAARVLREANDAATKVRQEAEVDAARRRHDAQAEAEAEVALAKQQGREMVNEARAYRERVLADLDRRTKLARQHIEELAHGRDRLLQVFERARLVAVDVTAELQANAGPDEFVSLSPTTGPVPLMVPATTFAPPTPKGQSAAAAAPFDHRTDDSLDTVTVEKVTVENVTVDPVIDDTAAGDAATVDLVEPEVPAESLIADVADLDEPTDETVDLDEPIDEIEPIDTVVPIAPARDHNVVALFPGRSTADVGEPDEEPAADPVDHARADVGDIFARLRSEATPVEPTASTDDTDTGGIDESDDADEVAAVSTPFTRRDEALVPLIVTAARKLKRALADEQNGVLDTLRQREPVTSLELIVPPLDAHVGSYAAAIADELAAAAAAGAAELGAKDTKTLRTSLNKAGALDGARAIIATDLVGALRDRIERSVVDGAGDNDDITRRVRAVYREWKTQHIDGQLDDVFRFAFGGGLAVTAEPGTPMVWQIDPSEPACADCEDNSLAGTVPSGESFPTGHTAAPAHAGCRCMTLPARH